MKRLQLFPIMHEKAILISNGSKAKNLNPPSVKAMVTAVIQDKAFNNLNLISLFGYTVKNKNINLHENILNQ